MTMSIKELKTQDDFILEVENLKKYFPIKQGILSNQTGAVKAVDQVSFKVRRGETMGIVGESGCGKSTMARVIIRLLDATEGTVKLEGKDLTTLSKNEMRSTRRDIQMVFQDPYASLNPRWTIEQTLMEPMKVYGMGTVQERKEKIVELMDKVGLDRSYAKRHPHEFSGGQRQRIGIARALVLNPKVIIADEPVSALDISVQAQVINLMQDLQDQFHLTYLFITHDLSVVEHISDRVAVMYLGKIVELASKDKLFSTPLHPYTVALMSAAPEVDRENKKERIVLKGDVPSPSNPPSGCAFHTRCPSCMNVCKTTIPELKEISPGQFAACHLYE